MSLSNAEVAHVLIALALLLVAAHGVGHLFAHFKQPRVIGEILGGLALGPTLFGALLPEQQLQIFPDEGVTAAVLSAVYQLGLFLLLYCSGAEIRSQFHRGDGKTVTSITLFGTLFPFVAGILFIGLFDPVQLEGTAGNPTSLLLVFAIATAVTSIPVISRIMFDLGILETAFARIVLAAAVIEDILLYVMLAIALGLVQQRGSENFGLQTLMGIDPGSDLGVAYHVIATIAFFGIFLAFGSKLFRTVRRFRYNLVNRSSPIAFQLVFMVAVCTLCVFLGVVPLLGAFVAGMVATTSGKNQAQARETIKSFSFAFFIPIYFAIVGLRLNLIGEFDPIFFLLFLTFACAVKSISVYAGSRIAGETPPASRNFAAAMNARGGPGIVLASAAFDAGIIDEGFYSTLVMLAIVTSLVAGVWLERVVRSGRPLRPQSPSEPVAKTLSKSSLSGGRFERLS